MGKIISMSKNTAPQAFFKKDKHNSSVYHPTLNARGPWDPNSLHGRVIAGLIAHEVEINYLTRDDFQDMQITRMTVDLLRLAPMAPLIIQSNIARSGRRIQVIDVQINTNHKEKGILEIARGSVILLKKSEEPIGSVWSTPVWNIDAPDENMEMPDLVEQRLPMWHTINIGSTTGPLPILGSKISAANSKDVNATTENQQRKIGPRRAWIRETHAFIENEIISPILRVAQVADFANPFVNSGTNGLNYINTDISLYLHRNPVGSWIGTETFYHGADDGISIATIALYDKIGKIGTSTVCGLAQVRS
jgi:hypothetical protein